MAFWDNLGQRATVTTAKAMQRAKDMTDIAKLNNMITEEENRINNNYYQIGKLYVTKHPDDYDEEFAGMIASINESNNKIKNYKDQMQDIKGVVRCMKCGSEVPVGAAFCVSCGAPIPKVQTPGNDNMVKCESCGSMVQKGMRFCTACGKPMVQPKSPASGAVYEEQTAEESVATYDNETPNQFIIENEPLEKRCPNCGELVEADAVFCTECGIRF